MKSPLSPGRLPEGLFLAGLSIMGIGLWWIWPPLCLVVAGIVFMSLGLWGAR
jgi:hypothetical protein